MMSLRRSISSATALALFATPLVLIVKDAPHWAALLRFCHNLWAGLTGSNGMVPSHILLFLLAVWVVFRVILFAATEGFQRWRWRRFLRSHASVSSAFGHTLVTAERCFAMTIGWFRPRTYCSTELRSRLSRSEFLAVLRHEASHRMRRDPLRIALWSFAAGLFPMLPYLRRSARAAISEYEYRADAAAERAGASPADLLSALRTAVSAGGTLPRFSAAPFAAPADLVNRVRLLQGESIRQTRSTRALLLSILVLALLFVPSITMRTNLVHAYHTAQCDAWPQVGPRPSPMSELPAGGSSQAIQQLSSESQ